MAEDVETKNRFSYRGQPIRREKGKFWIYCLARPFSSLPAAQRWIDRNICPNCLRAAGTCLCEQ